MPNDSFNVFDSFTQQEWDLWEQGKIEVLLPGDEGYCPVWEKDEEGNTMYGVPKY